MDVDVEVDVAMDVDVDVDVDVSYKTNEHILVEHLALNSNCNSPVQNLLKQRCIIILSSNLQKNRT
jgi:hypothetical protein